VTVIPACRPERYPLGLESWDPEISFREFITGFQVKPGMTQKMKSYYIYILASKRNGTLYIGVTSDLVKRIWEHKNKVVKGFTSEYNVSLLEYYEETSDVRSAIKREKQLKARRREWKLELIEKENPEWKDLYQDLLS
jgi:putative endonuclease